MSCPPAATLQIVALDAYHCQLLARMLDLLNPRLRRTWSASDADGGDATLVDVDDERGRRHALRALGSGLAGRTIAFGSCAELDTRHRVPKPLRLAPLLAALSAIEAEPAPPLAPAGDAGCFRLLDWPPLTTDAGPIPANELRVASLLARRPLRIADLGDLLGLGHAEADAIVAGLCARGLVARLPSSPVQVATPAAAGLHRLVATLRRRFGF